MTQPNFIEIELRSLFDQATHDRLKSFLDSNAQDLGEDDKDVHFFLLSDRYAKVVNNISKQNAKLVLKINKEGRDGSDSEEIEIPINQNDFEKAIKMFSALPFADIQESSQKRHNYLYKGIELALKHTQSWGYHLELEIMVQDKEKKAEAERNIREVADELGVKVMSPEEQADVIKRIDQQYRDSKPQTANTV